MQSSCEFRQQIARVPHSNINRQKQRGAFLWGLYICRNRSNSVVEWVFPLTDLSANVVSWIKWMNYRRQIHFGTDGAEAVGIVSWLRNGEGKKEDIFKYRKDRQSIFRMMVIRLGTHWNGDDLERCGEVLLSKSFEELFSFTSSTLNTHLIETQRE